MVRLKKGIASRCWENLVRLFTLCHRNSLPPPSLSQLLAIIGEQFIVGNEICGAVISIRSNEDIISLWNRTANDQTITVGIRSVLSLL